jgi:hypothetical protein
MMATSPTPELTLLAISSLRDCTRSSVTGVFIIAINATAGGQSPINDGGGEASKADHLLLTP